MGNVTLPTPVALTGAGLCVLGGYLLGVVTGPDSPPRTTATVDSYDPRTHELCLEGEGVAAHPGATEEGVLCGTWRRTEGSRQIPQPGDRFRFASMVVDTDRDDVEAGAGAVTVIYGDVVQ